MAKKSPRTSGKAASGPSPDASDSVKTWQERLRLGKQDYETWAKAFRVEDCAKYYLGDQWSALAKTDKEKRYTINMVFATMETQLPTLMFSRPKVIIEPRPARAFEPGSDVSGRATLLESAIQTFVDDRDVAFTFETTLALRDAYSRFGLVEVGYTADWIDNPNADKPILKEDSDEPMQDSDGKPVLAPKRVMKPGSRERLYVKRIPPNAFRVGPGRNTLQSNDWAAYYEWHYVEDVKANKDYANTAELKATGSVSNEPDAASDDPDRQKHHGQVKLWKVWDLRKQVKHVLAEGHHTMLQEDKAYTILPFAVMKFYEIADSFFPLPPIFNWISPQDEINETRDSMRTHRRRFVRRYMREPSVRAEEYAKLETGEDGVCIEVAKVTPPPIVPIGDADLSAQNTVQELAVTRDDFQRVAGVSGEAQGVPQNSTATQANIINVREQIRESRARTQVADWLGEICRLIMFTLKERMQLPYMVKMNVDPLSRVPDVQGIGRTVQQWQEVQSEDLGALDVDVKVDVSSLSPVAEDAQRASWNVVLQLLTNQPLLMLLMQPDPRAPNEPPFMLRKTLTQNGIKSDEDIRAIWSAGQETLKQQALMAMAAAVAKGGTPASGLPGVGTPTPAPVTPPGGSTTGTPSAGGTIAG